MKNQIKNIAAVILMTLVFIPGLTYSQSWGGKWKPGFWDNWSVNVNGGLTSFFGDLSLYDDDFVNKLTKESGAAFGMTLSKHFSLDRFAITGQLLHGSLSGQNSNSAFNSSLIEYNLQGRVYFVNLFSPYNITGFDIYFYAGVGQFIFKTDRYMLEDPSDNDIEDTGTPEFVYFFGVGMEYKIMDKFGVNASMGIRQAQNDKLDNFRHGENYDYYSYMSVGFSYFIDSFKKSSHRGHGRRGGGGRGRMPMRRR